MIYQSNQFVYFFFRLTISAEFLCVRWWRIVVEIESRGYFEFEKRINASGRRCRANPKTSCGGFTQEFMSGSSASRLKRYRGYSSIALGSDSVAAEWNGAYLLVFFFFSRPPLNSIYFWTGPSAGKCVFAK